MKLLSGIAIVLALAAAGCKKDPAGAPAANVGSGSAAALPGSAGTLPGSAVAKVGDGVDNMGSSAVGSGSSGSGSGAGSAVPNTVGTAPGTGSGGSDAADHHDEADDPTNYPHHDDAFDKLSHEDRHKLMKEHVTPEMKKAFQDFDPKHFAEFGCKTCHGKDPKAVHFRMPNPELPKLDFAALKAGKQAPKMAKFMGEIVEPQMAKILGAQPFDMATQKGFGCLDCHEQKK